MESFFQISLVVSLLNGQDSLSPPPKAQAPSCLPGPGGAPAVPSLLILEKRIPCSLPIFCPF